MNINTYSKFTCLIILLLFAGCAGGIQKTYWSAGTGVASAEEKKGNIEQAEIEYSIALKRAKNHLTPEDVSNSLYNLGTFYARQKRTLEAIKYLTESVSLEESLSGKSSIRTGRRIAALAIAYHMDWNLNEGRPLAKRLSSMATIFSGDERKMVDEILAAYKNDSSKDAEELLKWKSLAEKGDAKAQYYVATMYEDGRGVEKDINKAIALYKSSADKGYIEAQYYLGVIFDKGRGTAVDDVKAREWYRIASENGYPEAQFNYGVFLYEGRGGSINKDEALAWMRRSAEQGFQAAQAALKSLK